MSDVEIITAEEVLAYARRSLADLGMTYDELHQEAKRGAFRSERARLLWMAIAHLKDVA